MSDDNTAMDPVSELTKILDGHKKYWMSVITDLSEKLKKLETLTDLESEIYIRFQEVSEDCTEYSLLLARKAYEYKMKLGEATYRYKTAPENIMKARTDSYITTQVEKELAYDKYVIDTIEAHLKHMQNVSKNLNDIKYAIQNRIRVEEISRGIYKI